MSTLLTNFGPGGPPPGLPGGTFIGAGLPIRDAGLDGSGWGLGIFCGGGRCGGPTGPSPSSAIRDMYWKMEQVKKLARHKYNY